jgi:hypothetical protein
MTCLTTAKRGLAFAAHRRVTVPVLRLKTRTGQNETGFPAIDMAAFFITLSRQRTSFRDPAVDHLERRLLNTSR